MTQVVLTTWCVWVCYLRTRRTGCGTASFTLPNFKSNINTQKAKFSHFASAKNPTTLNLHLDPCTFLLWILTDNIDTVSTYHITDNARDPQRGLSRATYLLKVSRWAAEPNEEES